MDTLVLVSSYQATEILLCASLTFPTYLEYLFDIIYTLIDV